MMSDLRLCFADDDHVPQEIQNDIAEETANDTDNKDSNIEQECQSSVHVEETCDTKEIPDEDKPCDKPDEMTEKELVEEVQKEFAFETSDTVEATEQNQEEARSNSALKPFLSNSIVFQSKVMILYIIRTLMTCHLALMSPTL